MVKLYKAIDSVKSNFEEGMLVTGRALYGGR
jgi:hypothetical protein